MTHADLVAVGARWLKRSIRCSVVLVEPPPVRAQSPDVIGWAGGFSWMVECKVSRSDFFADQKKHGRVQGPRFAWRCYYLTPPGLLRPHEVPEAWGLLETGGQNVRRVREVPDATRRYDDRGADSLRAEVLMLFAELRRYHSQGLTYQTLTGRTAQDHLLLEHADADVREARQLMGLEARR